MQVYILSPSLQSLFPFLLTNPITGCKSSSDLQLTSCKISQFCIQWNGFMRQITRAIYRTFFFPYPPIHSLISFPPSFSPTLQTEFVVPPPDAKPGDRVIVPGDEAEPLSAAQVKRKKIWEALAPKLKTDDNLVATYDVFILFYFLFFSFQAKCFAILGSTNRHCCWSLYSF